MAIVNVFKNITKRFLFRKVQGGPFAGMRYGRSSCGSSWLPKLLGTYEVELHAALLQLLQRQELRFIDVGAAEGYYAIGALRLNPTCHAIAFEAQAEGRAMMREMALLNGVAERLDIRGLCEPRDLQKVVAPGGTLLLMDVEGAEIQLLDPTLVPGLASCHVIVELHPHLAPGVESILSGRFSPTHRVEVIPAREFSWHDIGSQPWRTACRFSRWLERRMLWERPPGMSWMLLSPRSAGHL